MTAKEDHAYILERVHEALPDVIFWTETSRIGRYWTLRVRDGADFEIWVEHLTGGTYCMGVCTEEPQPKPDTELTVVSFVVDWIIETVEKARNTRPWTLGKVLQFMDYLHHDAEAIRRKVPGFEKWLAEDPHITPYYMQDPMPAPLKDDE